MAFSDTIMGDLTLWDLIIFAVFIGLTLMIAQILYLLIRRYLDARITKKSSKSFARLTQYVLILIGLYIGFVILLKLNLSELFVSLGIISLAVALAAQQVLQNVFAGILISISKPIELEDWVEIGGFPITRMGKVKDISLMYTELREINGKIIALPNSFVISNKVVNYTRAGFVAFDIPIYLKQGTDLGKAYKIVLHEADIDENILPNLKGEEKKAFIKLLERPNIQAIFGSHPDMKMFDPQLNIVRLEESRITLNVKIWVKDPQRQDEIISKFLGNINRRFKEENIEMADT
ncbi:MAG: mechanosensitive ion channel [Methanomassiliicoccales archaeon]|nr:MAG: mechanosensitive ion channel [Methanomassiliicoccales archaeon]